MSTTPQIVQLIINDLGNDAGIVENYIWKLQQRITELEAQLPKWVSVDERLPREAGIYLVTKPYSGYLAVACLYFDGIKFDCEHRYIGQWTVIQHPQPPKEQNHE